MVRRAIYQFIFNSLMFIFRLILLNIKLWRLADLGWILCFHYKTVACSDPVGRHYSPSARKVLNKGFFVE